MPNKLNDSEKALYKNVLTRSCNVYFEKKKINSELLSRYKHPNDNEKTYVNIGDLDETDTGQKIGDLCDFMYEAEGNAVVIPTNVSITGLENIAKQGDVYFPDPNNDMCVDAGFRELYIFGNMVFKQGCKPDDEDDEDMQKYTRNIISVFRMTMRSVDLQMVFRFDDTIDYLRDAEIILKEKSDNWESDMLFDPENDNDLSFADDVSRTEQRILRTALTITMQKKSWQKLISNQIKKFIEGEGLKSVIKNEVNNWLR